jgi:flagellar biosynthesis/type III secretory pathway M-ring protein FliF/YscJ
MKYGSFIILFLFIYLVLFRPIRKQVFQALSVASLRPAGAGVAQLTSENSSMPFREAGPTERMTASAAPGAMANLQAGEPGAPDELLDAAGEEQIERELMKEAETADMDNRKYAAVKKKLVDKAKRDPEMVSQLIRSLLREKV